MIQSLGKKLLFPTSRSFGSVETDHLEIRTRLSAAVTTTQLLLERLKRYQRIILGKCSFRLTGPQKYVIGSRPSVYEMYRQKWPLKLLQWMEMSHILIQIMFCPRKKCFCWKNIGLENCIKSWQFSKNLCQSWFVTTDGITVWVKHKIWKLSQYWKIFHSPQSQSLDSDLRLYRVSQIKRSFLFKGL